VYDTVRKHEANWSVPLGEKVLQNRMLLDIKRDADGRVVKCKVRLVARGQGSSGAAGPSGPAWTFDIASLDGKSRIWHMR
jgi:hypothetical protein